MQHITPKQMTLRLIGYVRIIHRTVSVFTCSLSRLSGHPSYFSFWPVIIAGLQIRIRKGSIFVFSYWIRTRIRIQNKDPDPGVIIALSFCKKYVKTTLKMIYIHIRFFFSREEQYLVNNSKYRYKNQSRFELALWISGSIFGSRSRSSTVYRNE